MKKVPVCSGVPESTPLAARLSPAGNEPAASENVAVPIAPLCVKVWLNGEPATPLFAPGGVTVMVWQVMFRLYVGPDVQPEHHLPDHHRHGSGEQHRHRWHTV